MYEHDAFSQWLGIELIEIAPGKAVVRLQVRKEMLNGHGIAHGAITYALADSAFAFAVNSQGRKAVSIETSIAHLALVKADTIITAVAEEENLTHKIGIYTIRIHDDSNKQVALFRGTAYRSSESWEV
ncbi:UNVERIFIED_CONTAM: hypothetical protein GTU68_006180 [Idotea baltica]|nr:hypothetical protein [Idotea baltica]